MKLTTGIRKKFRVSKKVKKVAPKDRFRLCISRSMFIAFFPRGPSTFNILPDKATLTLSGIEIFILPILDIKIPYRLFLHQLFVFLHLYLSSLLLV